MRDEAEFAEFALGVRERLRRTAYLMCGDWEQASDHVQEGLIRVYVAWPRLTRVGGEYAYARKAVVSAYLEQARSRSGTETEGRSGREVASGPELADSVTAPAALMRALATLPYRQRACVVLRYFEALGVADTADVLGCTGGTVKSETSRALGSLRSSFDRSPLGELVTEGATRW